MIFRRYQSQSNTLPSFQSGTTMDRAQDKPLEKIVKSSYSKIISKIYSTISILECNSSSIYFAALKPFSRTLSVVAITSWLAHSLDYYLLYLEFQDSFFIYVWNRLYATLIHQQVSLFPRTSDTKLPKFSATPRLPMKFHGNHILDFHPFSDSISVYMFKPLAGFSHFHAMV